MQDASINIEKLSIQEKLIEHLIDSKKLLSKIEEESSEDTMDLFQQWSVRTVQLVRMMSAEQIVQFQYQIQQIAEHNSKIEKHFADLRAKVLTQIQENNHSLNAIQHYSNTNTV